MGYVVRSSGCHQVAVVSGLGKLKDPWGELVSWARALSVDSVTYRLFVDAVGRRGLATA